MSNEINELDKVAQELDLTPSMQHSWGIINSSSIRVDEFIDYFNKKAYLIEMFKYDIVELILQSYNDAILDNITNSELETKFLNFIKKSTYKKDETDIIILDYWRGIKDEEFPVGYLI